MESRTSTEKLLDHGLGHRRPTASDRKHFGVGPAAEGHVVYKMDTGEILWMGGAYEVHGVVAILEGTPCPTKALCSSCTCAQRARRVAA